MECFTHLIKEELGLHARPAGELIQLAGGFSCRIRLEKGEKSADAKRLYAVLSMGVRCGDQIHFSIEGTDEKQACEALKAYCAARL